MSDQNTSNPAGGNPPRPGDPVPDEGLDPAMVFAVPPTPPGTQGGQQPQAGGAGMQDPASAGGAQQDDGSGASMAQDQGPPPPPPGTVATREMGYDDEDLRVLGEVGDYRFGSIAAGLNNDRIVVPAHAQTTFDEQAFLVLLRGSISLTRDEKWRIIQAIPKLSQFQIDELQKILEEERRKFSELSPKHLAQLMKLEQKHSDDWRDLQSMYVQSEARKEEQSQMDDIRKQLGL